MFIQINGKYNKKIKIKKIKLNYINNNENLKRIFSHHNQKYTIDDLFKIVLFILKTGIY